MSSRQSPRKLKFYANDPSFFFLSFFFFHSLNCTKIIKYVSTFQFSRSIFYHFSKNNVFDLFSNPFLTRVAAGGSGYPVDISLLFSPIFILEPNFFFLFDRDARPMRN